MLAGKGGFNLTNSLQGEELTSKYSPEGFMNKALSDFDSLASQAMAYRIGYFYLCWFQWQSFPGARNQAN